MSIYVTKENSHVAEFLCSIKSLFEWHILAFEIIILTDLIIKTNWLLKCYSCDFIYLFVYLFIYRSPMIFTKGDEVLYLNFWLGDINFFKTFFHVRG